MALIAGSDIIFADGITIRQPTLGDIRHALVGLDRYNAMLRLLSLTLEDMIPPEKLSPLDRDKLDVFTLLMMSDMKGLLIDALSFFIREELHASDDPTVLVTSADGRIDKESFDKLRGVILRISCLKDDDVTAPKFGGKTSRRIYEMIAKGRAKKAKQHNPNLAIPNIISAVAARHPSLNLTNIWDLTVYQLQDQFQRTNVNAQVAIIGQRWAAWGKEDFDFTTWYKNNEKTRD